MDCTTVCTFVFMPACAASVLIEIATTVWNGTLCEKWMMLWHVFMHFLFYRGGHHIMWSVSETSHSVLFLSQLSRFSSRENCCSIWSTIYRPCFPSPFYSFAIHPSEFVSFSFSRCLYLILSQTHAFFLLLHHLLNFLSAHPFSHVFFPTTSDHLIIFSSILS